jgi:hypothetical protein
LLVRCEAGAGRLPDALQSRLDVPGGYERRSASVMLTPARLVKNPTAIHDLVDAHETPSSSLVVAPTGVGARRIVQLVPFQRAANMALPLDPTAVHAVVDAHDTATNPPPTGLGVRWIAQLVPFHRSARVIVPTRSVRNPTAVQNVLVVHDTPASPLLLAAVALGVRWIDQLMPCDRCASVTSTSVRLVKNPTAVHDISEAHDTPANWPYVAPAGFGVRSIDHLVPFHRSASITSLLARLAKYQNPTAIQDFGDAHDTPTSWLLVAPAGFGVRSIDQLLPSHRSANVASVFARSVRNPTAVQDFLEKHDTPRRLLLVAPAGFGVRSIDQLAPFHRCARVTSVPDRLIENPTAIQDRRDTHDAPASSLLVAPRGFGVRVTAQPEAPALGAIASHSASIPHPTPAQTIRTHRATPPTPPLPRPSSPAAARAGRHRSPRHDKNHDRSLKPNHRHHRRHRIQHHHSGLTDCKARSSRRLAASSRRMVSDGRACQGAVEAASPRRSDRLRER